MTVERYLEDDRRNAAPPDRDIGRRRAMAFTLPVELRAGWLAFQCESESRRLAPIPENWAGMSDIDLTRLALQAKLIVRLPKTRVRGA